jgi:F-type H+-transporting ATPase subunit epsilon
MARILLCEIVTPERIMYSGEIEMLIVPALDGELGVLPLHAPMVAALREGEVRVKHADETYEWFAVSGGYLQVHEDKAIVLADEAVASSQIDVDHARESMRLIEARLQELRASIGTIGSPEVDQLLHDLAWQTVQIKVAARR